MTRGLTAVFVTLATCAQARQPWDFVPRKTPRRVTGKTQFGSTFEWQLRDRSEWAGMHGTPGVRTPPARTDVDVEGEIKQHTRESFSKTWTNRSSKTSVCERHLFDFNGVPVYVVTPTGKLKKELPALREYMLQKEVEILRLPLSSAAYGNFSGSSAENSTTARSQYQSILSDSKDSQVVALLADFVRESVANYLACLGSTPAYFRDSPTYSKHMYPVRPVPLQSHSWLNVYHSGKSAANSLKWHQHDAMLHGYISLNTETAGTLFRSPVNVSERWGIEHSLGMLVMMPGGTLHTTTPWRGQTPRVTVAFNVGAMKETVVPMRTFELVTDAEAAAFMADPRHHTWPLLNKNQWYSSYNNSNVGPYLPCHTHGDGYTSCPPKSIPPKRKRRNHRNIVGPEL